MKEIPSLIKKDINTWAQYFQSEDMYHGKLPKGCEDLSKFLKLILVKIFRPEKVMHSFSYYVSDELGKIIIDFASYFSQFKFLLKIRKTL